MALYTEIPVENARKSVPYRHAIFQMGEKSVTVDVKREMSKVTYEVGPKPQRQQKPIVRSEKVSVKETMAKVDSGKAVKKPDKIRSSGSMEKPHPIQLPPTFKIFGKVMSVSSFWGCFG